MSATPSAPPIELWTRECRLPGPQPELSDAAAFLIAAGYTADASRTVLVRRVTLGMPIPTIGGFGELRRIDRESAFVERRLRGDRLHPVAAQLLRARSAHLARRRSAIARVVIGANSSYASGGKITRKQRKEGLHLDEAERQRLFDGLAQTPSPNPTGISGWVSSLVMQRFSAHEAGQTRFADRYETLLYLAGQMYDRIGQSPSWQSEYFAVQRGEVDLPVELSAIAADVITLRAVSAEIIRIERTTSAADVTTRHQQDQRRRALVPVWDQLVERVRSLAAMAEVLASADRELALVNEVNRGGTLDQRIDGLISRLGEHGHSLDATDRVGFQLQAGEEHLRAYREVLQGNIVSLSASRPELALPEPHVGESMGDRQGGGDRQ